MIFKKKKFGFKSIRYILESWPDLDQLKKEYSAIYILSYDKKDLPGFGVKEKDTPVVYFNKPLDDIFSAYSSTTRNEIRRTMDDKIPELKFVADDKDLKSNYNLSAKFEKSQGRKPDPISDYQGCKIFSAYYKNDLISSIACFDNGKVLRAKVICSKRLEVDDKEIYKIISFSTRRLVYEICKYGIENNYQLFDLGSVNFKKENLAKFKMSFTSDLVKEYTYTYKSSWFKLFEKLAKLKKSIKR